MTRRTSRWEGLGLEELEARWDRPQIHLYSSVDSTNTQAKRLADEEDAPAGTIVLADEQTGGRGRTGRRWYSPKGAGLYLSVILRPERLPSPLLVPLLAGLGLARAVEGLLEDVRVGLKWPNDLIVEDRKAGGVLSEVSWGTTQPTSVVVGVGINVHGAAEDFPRELRDVAISLDEAAGREVSRLELADRVLDEVEDRCAQPPERLDREGLRAFDEYDWLRDRRCAIQRSEEDEEEPLAGVAVGIAPDGALLFRPDSGALERVIGGQVIVEELPLPEY